MEKSETNQPATEKPVRKRSIVERAVVWVGIILLVGIAYVEATSRSQYEATYKGLESALITRDAEGKFTGVAISDLDKYIKGNPFRSDKVEEESTEPAIGKPVVMKKRRLRFQWPSLFKHYEFRLTTGKDDTITQIEPVIPGIAN